MISFSIKLLTKAGQAVTGRTVFYPPETGGRITTSSPSSSNVSMPLRKLIVWPLTMMRT
jgi:hypothetical protein